MQAPCAASALADNILSQTNDVCPQAVTALQSCVCSKGNNLVSISSLVSSGVSLDCGSTASQDQSSAATVLNAYCNQDSAVAFPTPTNPVSVYITDIPQISDLAPCASNELSNVVLGMTEELCPSDAPSLATCVCQKNQNSLAASQSINYSVKGACSGHTADISSAQAFFSAYCAMNGGITSFPTTSGPPGNSTTALGAARGLC